MIKWRELKLRKWTLGLLEIRTQVAEKLMKLGYKYVTLDLSGYQSGSMNKALNM